MSFPSPLPHGPLNELWPQVFFVTGTFARGPLVRFSRNMTVVQQGDELTVINAVRLSAQAEAELDRRGKVKHLVRLGSHTLDEPYYLDRYQPTHWTVPQSRKGNKQLGSGATPIAGSRVFLFEQARVPEAALLLEREGGILITCDSVQNWTTFSGASLLARVVLHLKGFGPEVVGAFWAKHAGPGARTDFERLLALEFSHLLSAHGTPIKGEAKAAVARAVAKRYG